MPTKPIEVPPTIGHKPIFAIAYEPDGSPLVIIGLSRATVDHLLSGDHFISLDLTRAGVPIKIMAFARETAAECLDMIKTAIMAGAIDAIGKDFKIRT